MKLSRYGPLCLMVIRYDQKNKKSTKYQLLLTSQEGTADNLLQDLNLPLSLLVCHRSAYMNCKNWFCYLVILLVVETVASVDDQYEACVVKSCGRGPNISYPFWIDGEQESYCGFPGFQLSCKNGEPVIFMSTDEYIIRDILYENQSFYITKTETPDICSPRSYRISLSHLPMTFAQTNVDLHLFFNCSRSLSIEYSSYSFGCGTDNLRNQSLALFSDNPNLTNVNQSGECKSPMVIPVENGNIGSSTIRDFIDELLTSKGFHLNWTASTCGECIQSGGRCGFDYDRYKFMCFCPDRPHHRSCDGSPVKDANIGLKVGIGVGTGVGGVLVSIVCFMLYQRRKRSKFSSSSTLISRELSSNHSNIPDPEKGSIYFKTPIFTYKELDEATNHFDSKKELGDGGFGTVYHGKLRDGRVVAVKRLFEHNYKRVDQFMNEIAILSGLRHRNLVSLYGCTSRHSRELLLVYEYVPNGTVADHLHGDRATACQLTWPIRLSIAIESADALAYLHASQIIHRDVKTNNILLDNGFHVKVADFGLSRLFPENVTHVSTAPQGTPGYVDPEYYQCYQLNDKSDVYSFGVVLIELISSKPAVDIGRHRHEINLANMAVNKIQHQALHELVDLSLGFDSDYNVRDRITLVAELAFRCLQQEKEMRPCMVEVLETLRGIESEEYKKKKSEEIDNSADARLLKNSPLSPVSVTDKWASRSTTPNTSS